MAEGITHDISQRRPSMGEGAIDAPEIIHVDDVHLNTELRNTLVRLWETKACADLDLRVRGREFPTHKFLMLAHCSYFQDMEDLAELSVVSLDLVAEAVNKVLLYLYQGQLEVTLTEIDEVLEVAEFLGVKTLSSQCLLKMPINTNNCLSRMKEGHASGNKEIYEKAMIFALENFYTLTEHNEFKSLPLQCIKCYLSHPDLKVKCEEDRVKPCLAWARSNSIARTEDLSQLLESLPLNKMHTCMLEVVLQDPILRGDDCLRRIIRNHMEKKVLKAFKSMDKEGTICLENGEKTKKMTHSDTKHTVNKIAESTEPNPDQTNYSPHPTDKTNGVYDIEKQCRSTPTRDFLSCGSDGDDIHSSKCNIPLLVSLGVQMTNTSEPTQYIQLFNPNQDHGLVDLGRLRSEFVDVGIKICIKDNVLYASGLGFNHDEIWRCVLCPSTLDHRERMGKMQTGLQNHATCFHNGNLYMIGGYTVKDGTCHRVIQQWNLLDMTSRDAGHLRHYFIVDSGGKPLNLTCCLVEEHDSILIYGAFFSERMFKHTVQVYSMTKRTVTKCLSLPKVSESAAICVLPLGGDTFLLVSNNYTATCTWKDIKEEASERVSYIEVYTVPNEHCGVLLSNDGQHVVLYGGQAKDKPGHHLYSARVTDILSKRNGAWVKEECKGQLGDCFIGAFDRYIV